MRIIITAFLALSFSAAVNAAQPKHCFDVLKDSELFSRQTARELNQSDKFLNWQCATAFSKHTQALDTGLNTGTSVYDTPLSEGGRWKKSDVVNWKDENCSMKARRTDIDAATFKFVKSNSPELLTDWASCMAERSPSVELSCAIEQVGNLSIFSATFSAADAAETNVADGDGDAEIDAASNADDSATTTEPTDTALAAATVESFQAAGGTCFPALQPGSGISKTATLSSCAADPNASLTIMLTTDRGSCWQMVEKDTSKIVIDGKTVLQGKTSYEADVIEFSSTAELITNGYDLIISAKKLIKIEGLPKITSFEAKADRPPGDDGRNAGPVIIKAGAVEGSKLLIFNHGEDGSAGTQGADGRKGVRGSPGRAGYDRGMKGCVGRKNGGKGRPGRIGQKGGAGGDAGDGGPVTIELKSKQFSGGYDRFVVSQSRLSPFIAADDAANDNSNGNKEYRCKGTCPGAAAPGGAGGQGGEGGRGGSGVRGSWPCGGVSPGTKGKQGKPGPSGGNGKEGQAGSILIL